MDQLRNKVTGVKEKFVKSIQTSSDVIELNGKIDRLEKQIREYYQELGKLYFDNTADKEIPSEYSKLFKTLKEAVTELDLLSRKMLMTKHRVICPSCNGDCSYSMSFCSFCGFDLSDAKENLDPTPKCMKCGNPISKGAAFCFACGAKLNLESESKANIQNKYPGDETWICSCGKSNEINERFCGHCGSAQC